jgi:SPP1 gp7 family putative phage head morphogenesis protein
MPARRVSASPPPFPSAVEARIKFASIGLLTALHAAVAAMVRPHARRIPGASHGQLVADVAAAGRDAGRYLRGQSYRYILTQQAERAARDIARHTAAIVGLQVPVARQYPQAFADAAWDKSEEEMDALAECMTAQVDVWLAGDEFDLDAAMQDCLDRSSNRWYAWLSMMLAWLAGGIVTETYRAAGVVEAEWVTREDRRVRPAHHALQGHVFRYDETPPLSAAVSSNGEDCWPGEDYGCRCTARIVSVVSRDSRRAQSEPKSPDQLLSTST